eukprot:TRINITY_DN5409_c0_g1_i1.p1 TRINITY_DN5409_c0_g1~~TRINITY_DN5409_c0_g1_i1.p1  ORF type:complete len:852 (+),score=230.31 TRINITY_DN5409_c0_g1_i1:131-2557(+)
MAAVHSAENGHAAAMNGVADGMVWSADGMSQDQLMLKDECIVVNYLDEVIGHDNKYNCHKFVPGQPRGILHRAFSVMLFNSKGELLLQQRARSKITFPDVWTNTCCTHPLHGMCPSEVDTSEQIASGQHKGVKHAAIRKLNHELGIPKAQLDVDRFKFMTRVHYWAADVLSHGEDAPWGEHEIDHLLLYRLQPGEELTLELNPDEVQAVRWIAREDLMQTLDGEGKLAQEMPLWSPWFRIIAQRLMDKWWQDLDTALTTDTYVDTTTIHRFDPGQAHQGGAGRAGPALDASLLLEQAAAKESEGARRRSALEAEHQDLVRGFVGRGKAQTAAGAGDVKQGAYGKVPTHKITKFDQFSRPLEVVAALRMKFGGVLVNNITSKDPDVLFCDKMLGKVSRSFAAVIRQLPEGISMDICVFYLALRALDTVEDDMEAYKGKEDEKQAELRKFGAERLGDNNMSLDGIGEGDERALLQEFGKVAKVYNVLPAAAREVIRDITDKMGAGMAEYVSADLAQGTKDQAAYDRYCHMVAGLVGEGLTRLFVARGYETDALAGQGERVWAFCADPAKNPKNCGLANSMGLFLQKANIIRDYLEDYVDGRAFWPQSVWRRHAKTTDLGEFARPTAHAAGSRLPMKGSAGRIVSKGCGDQALLCLNELVADALELVPDCLEYLARIRTEGIYVFCAIPQLMAMATLCECVDNPKLFTGVVKIRKGLTCRLIQACVDGQEAVHWWFSHFAEELLQRITSGQCAGAETALGARIGAACSRICALTRKKAEVEHARKKRRIGTACGIIAVGAAVAAAKWSSSS